MYISGYRKYPIDSLEPGEFNERGRHRAELEAGSEL